MAKSGLNMDFRQSDRLRWCCPSIMNEVEKKSNSRFNFVCSFTDVYHLGLVATVEFIICSGCYWCLCVCVVCLVFVIKLGYTEYKSTIFFGYFFLLYHGISDEWMNFVVVVISTLWYYWKIRCKNKNKKLQVHIVSHIFFLLVGFPIRKVWKIFISYGLKGKKKYLIFVAMKFNYIFQHISLCVFSIFFS